MNLQAVIAEAQTALKAEAREHKRLEFAHRKSAKRLMQLAERMQAAVLAEHGISYVHIGTDEKESKP